VRDWRSWALLALFAVVVGLHLAAPRLDSDQAITGLMGLHVLRGELPIFFWGQHHAGVPESYGAAVTFFVLGVSRFALSLVPALAALGLVLALYRTGALLFGPGAGRLAILFATVVSPYVVAHYVRARAYYIEHLLLGQIVLAGAALLLARPLTEAARTRVYVALGLAGGVGLYCGFQIVDALLPAFLALLWVDPGLPLRRGAWLGLGAFLLGSAPFWLYNLTHDWATFATGARFAGRESPVEAARVVLQDLMPVILGVQDYVNTPPFLPWPFSLAAPVVAGAAVALLLGRVLWHGWRGVRRDPGLAGEALVLLTLAVTLGAVWYGRFLSVPRYLVPVAPPLALALARACQLTWRRAPALAVAGAAVYLGAVGVGLVGDLTVLWPETRAAYRAERAQDAALFDFLRARNLRLAYGYEYWLTARLTFDAREEIVIAEPYNDKHPPYTEAVDASPRPAYVVRGGLGLFENWIAALQLREFGHGQVGPYAVFWGFAPPAPVAPVPRAGWSVQVSPGTGEPAGLADGRLDTGWSSAPGPPVAAWVEVTLPRPAVVTGAVLATDQPEHVPQQLLINVADDGVPPRTISRYETGGFTASWRNGALRAVPSRALVVRFPPVETRRLRFHELARSGSWAVAEVFLLGPAAAPGPPPPAVAAGRRLEASGALAPALRQYRAAMREAPDDAEGYAEFMRLGGQLGLNAGWPAEQAARHAQLGLLAEAGALYARVAGMLGEGIASAELADRRADVAAAAGDAGAAGQLRGEAAAARAGAGRAARFGRAVELAGITVTPARVRPGEPVEVAYRWRFRAPPRAALAAAVQFRGGHGRFDDDHGVPGPIRGLDAWPQHLAERRRVLVPATTPPGRYRIVVGVREPGSGQRLRRWWAGLVPLPTHTVEVGVVEVAPSGAQSMRPGPTISLAEIAG
jgi:hypothetical protein